MFLRLSLAGCGPLGLVPPEMQAIAQPLQHAAWVEAYGDEPFRPVHVTTEYPLIPHLGSAPAATEQALQGALNLARDGYRKQPEQARAQGGTVNARTMATLRQDYFTSYTGG